MPELPEVETVRAGIVEHALDAVIERVTVHDPRSLRRHMGEPAQFENELTGAKIVDAARRGKYLWLVLATDNAHETVNSTDDAEPSIAPWSLVIHLGMSGQVLFKDSSFEPDKHLKITIDVKLRDGSETQLRFVDQRIFGGMFLDDWEPSTDSAGEPLPAASRSVLNLPLVPRAISHIARDPLDPNFSYEEFRAKLRKTSSGIKRLLLDQSVISGVGNIYADEALWRTKLHYNKPAKTLSATQSRVLVDAISDVMKEALIAGGTSFDALYVNVNGQSGYFDRSLNAYGQAGKPCPRCLEAGVHSIIVREPFMTGSSYLCPRCQRAPRSSEEQKK